MIYHAYTLTPQGKPSPVWWAVHAETLTPVRIDSTRLPRVTLEVLAPPPGETHTFCSHPDAVADSATIAAEVLQSVRQSIHPEVRSGPVRVIDRSSTDLPEYLLILDGNGGNPAIFRSADPHLIIPADAPNESVLSQPRYWRSTADLPASGWEYWWEDSQRAWDKLVPQLIESVNEAK